MQFAFRPPSRHRYEPSWRSRAGSAVLSLAVCALLFVMLLRMGAFGVPPEKEQAQLVALDLRDKGAADKPKPAPKATSARNKAVQAQAAPVARALPPPVPLPSKATWPPGFIVMKRSDYAAADIAGIRHPDAAAGGGAGSGGGDASGPGEGPGGVRLFNAEWYREPSHGELAGYLPNGAPPGSWGEIACRTVDHFHVEDCQELGESPRGSGLARALRRASWQFLVRPPRKNGQAQVGAWVRIHFSFTQAREDGAAGSDGG